MSRVSVRQHLRRTPLIRAPQTGGAGMPGSGRVLAMLSDYLARQGDRSRETLLRAVPIRHGVGARSGRFVLAEPTPDDIFRGSHGHIEGPDKVSLTPNEFDFILGAVLYEESLRGHKPDYTKNFLFFWSVHRELTYGDAVRNFEERWMRR